MGFFRRRDETLNEILLREAGLTGPQPAAPRPASEPDPEPQPEEAEAVSAPPPVMASRASAADAMVVVRAPLLAGDVVEFVTLPSGDVIVDVEQGDTDLSPLADAVEAALPAPYRARGQRQQGDLWGVAATRIDVRSFSCADGDELELVRLGGRRTLTVDSAPSRLQIPELERAGEELPGEDYAVQARRIDGDFWEIRAAAL